MELIENIASSLLLKLNKLDRENVKRLIEEHDMGSSWLKSEESKDKFAEAILSLIPEEGEVVAEGKLRFINYHSDKIVIYFDGFPVKIALGKSMPNNQQIQILIREVK
jgi:hypothetical protein